MFFPLLFIGATGIFLDLSVSQILFTQAAFMFGAGTAEMVRVALAYRREVLRIEAEVKDL
jgi:hypothetical protein